MGHVITLNNKEAHVLKQILNVSGCDLQNTNANAEAASDLDIEWEEVQRISHKIWKKIKPNCWKPGVNVEYDS